jgi:hypothetical protein
MRPKTIFLDLYQTLINADFKNSKTNTEIAF